MRRALRTMAFALLCAGAESCAARDAQPARGPLVSRLAALRIERPFYLRWSIPLAWRDCEERHGVSNSVPPDTTRSPSCTRQGPSTTAAIAALSADVATQVKASGSVDALHAAALLDLLWSREDLVAIDRAVGALESTRLLAPGDAALLTDLGAAYYLRGVLRPDPGDLAQALELTSLALAGDSARADAAFNRVQVLEALGLFAQASAAATQAVARARDPDPRWTADLAEQATADAARASPVSAPDLTVLSGRALDVAVLRDLARARGVVWDTLLPRWGTAMLRQDSAAAARALAQANAIVRQFAPIGEGTSARVLHEIAAAPASERAQMAVAHAAFGAARAAYERDEFAPCLASLDTALRVVRPERTLYGHAQLWRAICVAQAGPPGEAIPTYAALVARGDRTDDVPLAARARASLAAAYMRLGRTAEALPLLRESREAFRSVFEVSSAGLVQSLESVARRTLGDRSGTYWSVRKAAEELAGERASVRLHNTYYLMAELMLQDSLPRAALAAQLEGLSVARNSRYALNIAEAEVALSRIHRALGDEAAAATALRRARATLDTARASDGRRWVAADLQLGEGEDVLLHPSPLTITRLDSAIAFYRAIDLPLKYLPAMRLRAEQRLRAGQVPEAQRDLEALVVRIEADLRSARDPQLRTSLLALGRSATEVLMRIALAAHDTAGALAWLERGRSGAADMQVPASPQAVGTMLDLALVSDTLFAFVITPTAVTVRRTPVAERALRAQLRRVRSRLEAGLPATAVQRDLEALHALLLGPVAPQLPDSGAVLTLVADGELAEAPVAAFRDAASGRMVIERWGLRFATSLRDAGHAAEGTRVGAVDGAVLLVGDPAFDAARYPLLPRLQEASREIRAVAAFYPHARLLEDSAATLVALRRAATGARVLHFAGHATFDAAAPQASELVLAGTERATAASLASLDLRGTALVVLAACETARAGEGRAGGLLGLVSALRAAGASTVVGGTWRTPDRAARLFFTAFHEAYARSGDAARALRAAQLLALRSGERALQVPQGWAGYRVVGSH